MFKFRQPSICSDLDIVSDSDSVSDVAEEIQKGVSINSISEPRTITLGSADSENKSKGNSIVDGDSGLTGNERIETDGECSRNHEVDSCSGSASSCLVDGTAGLTSSDKNGGGPSVTATAAAIMCDRKRKERHESCSQGQEKKVIRSLSHPKVEAGGGDKSANDLHFRRTQSNDSFQPNRSASPPPSSSTTTGADEDENSHGLLAKHVCRSGMQMNGHAEQNNQVTSTSSAVDSSSYGVGSRPIPVQSSNVRNMPQYFEAELQRQWERSAQWNSNGNRKGHSSSSRKHRSSRSSKPSEVSASTTSKRSNEDKKDERRDSDELIEENIMFAHKDDDLGSPTSEESSSSIESLEDVEDNGNKLVISPTSSCEDIETDVVEDPIVAYKNETTSSANRNHPSLGSENSLEPLPHVDFANLHHQVGTNEPISFLKKFDGIEDQVMLSPRNSILLKDMIDPNMPPSPPLYQAPLDPPISRQHGGNQNMKINQLSRQISNLKKHLKTLEEEHEQLFGYKPSHADKLNHKEMRKCLLHLTKAKREMKQMREDPANVRIGGNLLQVMNAGQVVFSRNSADALKSLDETVREITKTLSDKRRAQCRPEDPALMNPSELNEEKSDMQKQLLMLEKRHGRPSSKEEKDVVRSLYDRYRSLKKSGGGARLGNIKENSIDLAPILEYEPLELTQQNEVEGGNNNTSVVELRRDSLPGVASSSTNSPKGRRRRIIQSGDDGDDGDCSIINFGNEGFTEMSLVELEAAQKSAREEKRRLRVMLRKFEYDFQNATGRLPQKDEKYSTIEMESIYQKYKKRRATVRLLDVLITKQRAIESGG